jgi:DNA-directed RNA polymerase subunit RPC12/RpoP
MTTQFMIQTETSIEEKHHCLKCKKAFDEPELITYHACPHCHAKIEEERKTNCQYWYGYLHEKEKNEPIPHECVECEKAVECMLNQQYNSPTAVAEIKKWYSP